MADARRHHEQLGEPCFLRRARAEVGGDRRDDRVLVALGQREQSIEPIAAHRERRIRLGLEGAALRREAGLQLAIEPCLRSAIDCQYSSVTFAITISAHFERRAR